MRLALCRALLVLCCAVGAPASAAELRMIFTQYTPPYVIEDGSGILVEIVRTALESSGHTVKPVYVPIGRGFKMFTEKQADGTTILLESSGVKAQYSQNFMQYHNRAFALKARKSADPHDRRLEGQVGHRVPERRKVPGRRLPSCGRGQSEIQGNGTTGRPDPYAAALPNRCRGHGRSIFRFYRQKLINEGKADRTQEYVGFNIFPPTPYKAAFHEPKVRDDFDKAIAAMRKDGRYDAIYRKYAERYFPVEK
jgi:polar amino acid transport system substrate-binding protein